MIGTHRGHQEHRPRADRQGPQQSDRPYQPQQPERYASRTGRAVAASLGDQSVCSPVAQCRLCASCFWSGPRTFGFRSPWLVGDPRLQFGDEISLCFVAGFFLFGSSELVDEGAGQPRSPATGRCYKRSVFCSASSQGTGDWSLRWHRCGRSSACRTWPSISPSLHEGCSTHERHHAPLRRPGPRTADDR